MSEKIELYKIEAPSLSSVEYGADINQQFENINLNFQKLVNSGFTEGKMGESIKLKQIILSDDESDGDGYILFNAFKVLINSSMDANKTIPISINDKMVNWYDDIIGKTVFAYTSMIDDNTNETKIVSIIPFTVKDSRFASSINYTNINQYKTIEDVSCNICFKFLNNESIDISSLTSSNFEIINNIPTLYFDDLTGVFCWKVWGQYTGLIANGPRGEKGKDGDLVVCIRDSKNSSNNSFKIPYKVINGNTQSITQSDVIELKDSIAIILPDSYEQSLGYEPGFWVSNLNEVNGELYAVCSPSNNILTKLIINTEYFETNIMPNIRSWKFTNNHNNRENISINTEFSDGSNGGTISIDDTLDGDNISGDLVIRLNTEIVSQESNKNSFKVDNDGIHFRINGKKYKISVEEDGNMKANIES